MKIELKLMKKIHDIRLKNYSDKIVLSEPEIIKSDRMKLGNMKHAE